MGKVLIATYYKTENDMIIEENGYDDDFDMAYQGIKFDDRANNFKGSMVNLLKLILLLTETLNSLDEDQVLLSHTIKYLWIVYCELQSIDWNYVHISVG